MPDYRMNRALPAIIQPRYSLSWLMLGLAARAVAGGPYGADNGWAIDNSGNALLTSAVAAQMSQGETGWIRIEMRLIPGHTTWDAAMLGYYDAAVNNARAAGIQVLLLIDGGSWPGSQPDWTANNAEHNPGANGDNLYVEGYATNAVLPIVQHFRDRVKYYELWNEPNCWNSNYTGGYYYGCTYIYPSNYGWLLARSWEAVHITAQVKDVTLFFGGVFGHNIGGITSYANAGAQYIDDTYSTGTNAAKGAAFRYTKTNYNAYPLDGVGQHFYLNTGGLVASNTVRQYEDWVRQACTKYEGTGTLKKTFTTEFGWQTTNSSNGSGVSLAVQDTNLLTAFSAIRATPYVQMAIWFQWKDNPAGRLWYGVVDSANNPKPSYADYQWAQRFEGIYATGSTNADIQGSFYARGQAVLGNPFDHGHGPWVYAFLNGYAQDFDGGSHRTLSLMSSTNGTFELNDLHGLWSFYHTNNGAANFGWPLGNETAFGTDTKQDFSRGSLTWDPVNQVAWWPRPRLAISPDRVVSWAGPFALQSATNPAGPYADVPGATNPYTNPAAGWGQQYFRTRN